MPLMTDSGTFIINGAERVIVSQLVRSSGIDYAFTHDKTGKKLFTCTVIPNRGAWLEYETDSSDNVFVRIDKNRKLSIVALIKALGLVEHREILEYFGDNNLLQIALEKDTIKTREEALIAIYKKLRPGELPTVDAARNLFNGLFFDDRRYDLAKVGRYKFNKKLSLSSRIAGQVAFEDIIDAETGEVFVEKDTVISEEVAENIRNAGINIVDIKVDDKKVRIIGNGTVNIHKVLPNVDLSDLHIKEYVHDLPC